MKKIIFIVLVLVLGMVSASFELGEPNSSLTQIYGAEQPVTGWINLSLSGESADNLFEDTRGNSISLMDLLDENTGYEYSCSPVSCLSDYAASNPESTKVFNMNLGGEELTGFNLVKNIGDIYSIDFDISSSGSAGCSNQVKIDLFNDGIIDDGNRNVGTSFCGSNNYGCFDSEESLSEYSIDSNYYCQKVTLPEAPGFVIGAWVKKTSGSMVLKMDLFDTATSNWVPNGECSLGEPTAQGGEISCDIDYLVTEPRDFYVCLYSNSGSGEYYIRGYSDYTSGCGFHDYPVPSQTPASYQIYAKAKSFGTVGTLQINDELPSGDSFAQLAENYILDNYGSLDCSSSGCVIPVSIVSGASSNTVTLSNLEISFNGYLVGTGTETSYYDLTETASTISSDFGQLYLDSGDFLVPSDSGDYDFELSLDGESVFTQTLSVEDLPTITGFSPRTTATAFPTTFSVTTTGSNLSEYLWDFGDGTTLTTATSNTSHTYEEIGFFNLTITIPFGETNVSKTYNITVGSPDEIIQELLEILTEKMDEFLIQISDYDLFYQDSILSALDLESAQESLVELEARYYSSEEGDTEELNEILTGLLEIEIPDTVSLTMTSTPITYFPSSENIDLDVLQAIGGGDYDYGDEILYVDAINTWNLENLETKISFNEFSAAYNGEDENPFIRIFEVEMIPFESVDEAYLIVENMEDLEFKEDYSQMQESGYYYIDIYENDYVVFSTSETVDFVDLPLFISPPISELSISSGGGINIDTKNKNVKWVIFILVLILLLFIGIGVYVALQTWYKKKYEKYLFKNQNNLYNMVNYIQNSKRIGMDDGKIISNLKKAGWTGEQIRYVMRKYYGKRTGMYELGSKKNATPPKTKKRL